MQVLHALLPILCSKDCSQQTKGAQQFAIHQIGGHVCIQGVFQVTFAVPSGTGVCSVAALLMFSKHKWVLVFVLRSLYTHKLVLVNWQSVTPL